MSIDEARREAIINKLKELEEFLEPEGAHFVLHLFTSRDVTEESYSLYNNCSLKILAMSQARIENYIEQLGKISLKHHKENVELMKLVDKLGETVPTITGDHNNRITDYTALCCEAVVYDGANITSPLNKTNP